MLLFEKRTKITEEKNLMAFKKLKNNDVRSTISYFIKISKERQAALLKHIPCASIRLGTLQPSVVLS